MPAHNPQKEANDDFRWEGLYENLNDLYLGTPWNSEQGVGFMDYQIDDLDLTSIVLQDDASLFNSYSSTLLNEQGSYQPLERRRSSGDALASMTSTKRDWFASTYQGQVANIPQKEIMFVNESHKYFKGHRASTGCIRMADIHGASASIASSQLSPAHPEDAYEYMDPSRHSGSIERRRSAPGSSVCLLACPWNGCTKAFGRMYNLQSHYRTHTKEKPYGCAHCPMFFARNHDLKRHQRAHFAEKQYVCPVCMRKFSRSDALHRHRSAGSCFKRNQIE
jgi:hypothetical protein